MSNEEEPEEYSPELGALRRVATAKKKKKAAKKKQLKD
jgi:hypothetical protein